MHFCTEQERLVASKETEKGEAVTISFSPIPSLPSSFPSLPLPLFLPLLL